MTDFGAPIQTLGNPVGDELYDKALSNSQITSLAIRKAAQNVGLGEESQLGVGGMAAASGKTLADMALGFGRAAGWVGSGFGAWGDTSWMPDDLYDLLPRKYSQRLATRIGGAGFLGDVGQVGGTVMSFAGGGGAAAAGAAGRAVPGASRLLGATSTGLKGKRGLDAAKTVGDMMVRGATTAATLPGRAISVLEKPGSVVGRGLAKLPIVREWAAGSKILPQLVGAGGGFGMYEMAKAADGDRVGQLLHGMSMGAVLRGAGMAAGQIEKGILGVDPSKVANVTEAYEKLAMLNKVGMPKLQQLRQTMAERMAKGDYQGAGLVMEEMQRLRIEAVGKQLSSDGLKRAIGAKAAGTAVEAMGWAAFDQRVTDALLEGDYETAMEHYLASVPGALFARHGKTNAARNWRRATPADNTFGLRVDVANQRRRAAGMREIPYYEPQLPQAQQGPEPSAPQGPEQPQEPQGPRELPYSGPTVGPERQIENTETIYAGTREPEQPQVEGRDPDTIDMPGPEPGVSRPFEEKPSGFMETGGTAIPRTVQLPPGSPGITEQMRADPTGYVADQLLQAGWEIADGISPDGTFDLQLPLTNHKLRLHYDNNDASRLEMVRVPADVFRAVRGDAAADRAAGIFTPDPEKYYRSFQTPDELDGLRHMQKGDIHNVDAFIMEIAGDTQTYDLHGDGLSDKPGSYRGKIEPEAVSRIFVDVNAYAEYPTEYVAKLREMYPNAEFVDVISDEGEVTRLIEANSHYAQQLEAYQNNQRSMEEKRFVPTNIPYNTYGKNAEGFYDKSKPVSGLAPIIKFGMPGDSRAITVRKIYGVSVPFYLSTGRGGKETVKPGRWYPFFGVGEGWFNKGTQEDINDYYGIPELRQVARQLDREIGDVRDKDFPHAIQSSPHLDVINEGFDPVDSAANAKELMQLTAQDLADRIEEARDEYYARQVDLPISERDVLLNNWDDISEFIADVSGVTMMRQMGSDMNLGGEEKVAGEMFSDGEGGVVRLDLDGNVINQTFPINVENPPVSTQKPPTNLNNPEIPPELEPWFDLAKSVRHLGDPTVGVDLLETALLFAVQGSKLSPSNVEMRKALDRIAGTPANMERWANQITAPQLEFLAHMLGRIGSGHGTADQIVPVVQHVLDNQTFNFSQFYQGEDFPDTMERGVGPRYLMDPEGDPTMSYTEREYRQDFAGMEDIGYDMDLVQDFDLETLPKVERETRARRPDAKPFPLPRTSEGLRRFSEEAVGETLALLAVDLGKSYTDKSVQLRDTLHRRLKRLSSDAFMLGPEDPKTGINQSIVGPELAERLRKIDHPRTNVPLAELQKLTEDIVKQIIPATYNEGPLRLTDTIKEVFGARQRGLRETLEPAALERGTTKQDKAKSDIFKEQLAQIALRPEVGPEAIRREQARIVRQSRSATQTKKESARRKATPAQLRFRAETPDFAAKLNVPDIWAKVSAGKLTPQQFSNEVVKHYGLQGNPTAQAKFARDFEQLFYENNVTLGRTSRGGQRGLSTYEAIYGARRKRGSAQQTQDVGSEGLRAFKKALRSMAEGWAEKAGLYVPKSKGNPKPDNILKFIREAGGLSAEQLTRMGLDIKAHGTRFLKAKGILVPHSENKFSHLAQALQDADYMKPEAPGAGEGSGDFESQMLDLVESALAGAEVRPLTEYEKQFGRRQDPIVQMKQEQDRFFADVEERVAQRKLAREQEKIDEQLEERGFEAVPERLAGEDALQQLDRLTEISDDATQYVIDIDSFTEDQSQTLRGGVIAHDSGYEMWPADRQSFAGESLYAIRTPEGEPLHPSLKVSLIQGQRLVTALAGRPDQDGRYKKYGMYDKRPGERGAVNIDLDVLAERVTDVQRALSAAIKKILEGSSRGARWATQQRPEIIREVLPNSTIAPQLRRANSIRRRHRGEAVTLSKPGVAALNRDLKTARVSLKPKDLTTTASGQQVVVQKFNSWQDVHPGLEDVQAMRWEMVGQYMEGVTPAGAEHAIKPANANEEAWAKSMQDMLGYLWNEKRAQGGWQGAYEVDPDNPGQGRPDSVRLMREMDSYFFPRFRGKRDEVLADEEVRAAVFAAEANLNPDSLSAAEREDAWQKSGSSSRQTYQTIDMSTGVEQIRRDKVAVASVVVNGRKVDVRETDPKQVVLNIERLQSGEVASTQIWGQDGSPGTRKAVYELLTALDPNDPYRLAVEANLQRGGSEQRLSEVNEMLNNTKGLSKEEREFVASLVEDGIRYAQGAGDLMPRNSAARSALGIMRAYRKFDALPRSAMTIKQSIYDVPEFATLLFAYSPRDAWPTVKKLFTDQTPIGDLVEHYIRLGSITPRMGALIYEEAGSPFAFAAKGMGWLGEKTELLKAAGMSVMADMMLTRWGRGKWTEWDSDIVNDMLVFDPETVARFQSGTFTMDDANQFRTDFVREATRRAEQGEGVPMVDNAAMTATFRFLRFQTEHQNRVLKSWIQANKSWQQATSAASKPGDFRKAFRDLGHATLMSAHVGTSGVAGELLGIMIAGLLRAEDDEETRGRVMRTLLYPSGWKRMAERAVGGGLPSNIYDMATESNVKQRLRSIAPLDTMMGLVEVTSSAVKELAGGGRIDKIAVDHIWEAAKATHMVPFEADIFNRGYDRIKEEAIAAYTGQALSLLGDYMADRDLVFEFLQNEGQKKYLGIFKEQRPIFEKTKMQSFYDAVEEGMTLWQRAEAQKDGSGWAATYDYWKKAVDMEQAESLNVRGPKSVAGWIRRQQAMSLIDDEDQDLFRQTIGNDRFEQLLARDRLLHKLATHVGRIEGELPPDYSMRLNDAREVIATGGGAYRQFVEEAVERSARSIMDLGTVRGADFSYTDDLAAVLATNREVFRDVFKSEAGFYISSDEQVAKYPNRMVRWAQQELKKRALAKAKKKREQQREDPVLQR